MAWSLQENVGATDAMEPIPVGEGIRPIPVPALPPYNGFGSFEDSEQSCKNLVSPAHLLPPALACLSVRLSLTPGLQLPLPACLPACLSVRQDSVPVQHCNSSSDDLCTASEHDLLPDSTSHDLLGKHLQHCSADYLPSGIHAMLSLHITDV